MITCTLFIAHRIKVYGTNLSQSHLELGTEHPDFQGVTYLLLTSAIHLAVCIALGFLKDMLWWCGVSPRNTTINFSNFL